MIILIELNVKLMIESIGRNSEKRAILVFFESKAKLMQFHESPALEFIKDSVIYLTEDALLREKETIINRATVSGQITLFARTFGRGTDFICHDQIIATIMAVHMSFKHFFLNNSPKKNKSKVEQLDKVIKDRII